MHWLNCISPIEPKAQEVVPLKITTSYLSFYCCWFIEPFFECIKEFSRIVCVSLFSYQGSLFFCLSDSSFTLSHLFLFVKNFFQVFSNFFDVLLSNSLSRWQLVYFTTLRKDCQQVFWLFSKFFKLFLQKNHFFVTARLIYHFLPPLSTVFFINFSIVFSISLFNLFTLFF